MPAIKNLNHHFQYLDTLPDSLYKRVVTLHYGSLKSRACGILVWRKHLLSGQLPQKHSLHWPEEKIFQTIIDKIDELQIINDCKNQDNLVDEILLATCDSIEKIIRRRQQDIHELFDAIANKSIAKQAKKNKLRTPSKSQVNDNSSIQNSNINDNEINVFKLQLAKTLSSTLKSWREIKDVYSSIGLKPARGWDLSLSKGEFKSHDWQNIIMLRKLIKGQPQLISIIEKLGRNRNALKTPAEETNYDGQRLKSSTIHHDKKQTTPMSIDGITRSDDISRMLPSEATLLNNPILKMLWHTKRAEQSLLCYQVQGVLSTRIPANQPESSTSNPAKITKKGDTDKGPIILCIDTSGSMKGEPELIAKAISLEVTRFAMHDNRDCLLYLFSSTEEFISLELDFSYSGIKKIIHFLQSTFHGGTDVVDILKRASRMISKKKWNKADILLISDGLFKVDASFEKELTQLKKKSQLRIHGLLVGGWRTQGMTTVCHPLHNFQL